MYDRPLLIANRQQYEELHRRSVQVCVVLNTGVGFRYVPAGACPSCVSVSVVSPALPVQTADRHSIHPSRQDPAGFWAHEAEDYYWNKKWTGDHHEYNFDLSKGRIGVEWFKGARTNITYNCLDRWGKGCLLIGGCEFSSETVESLTPS